MLYLSIYLFITFVSRLLLTSGPKAANIKLKYNTNTIKYQ